MKSDADSLRCLTLNDHTLNYDTYKNPFACSVVGLSNNGKGLELNRPKFLMSRFA